jgi:hypothetical protein
VAGQYESDLSDRLSRLSGHSMPDTLGFTMMGA